MNYIVTYEIDSSQSVFEDHWETKQSIFTLAIAAQTFVSGLLKKSNIQNIQVFKEIQLDAFLKND